MNWFKDFLPTVLIIPFFVYAFVKHEIAEWSYERGKGLQGSSASFGMFVDTSAFIGTFGLYLLVIAYAYDQSWQKAAGLYIGAILIGFVDQFVPVLIKKSSTSAFVFFRLACLIALYVLLIYLCFQLTWFGLWKHR